MFSKNIVKEGQRPVIVSGLVALFAFIFIPSLFIKLLCLTLFIFFIFVYFNSQTKVEIFDKNAVFSPVDGEVIEKKEYKDKKILKIYKNFLNNSHIKAPIEGEITDISIKHGAFLNLTSQKSDKLNEKLSFNIRIDDKNEIKIDSITDKYGFFGFNLYKQKNQKCVIGENIGFASNAIFEITLPKYVELKVNIGDQVVGGINIIGYIKGNS